MSARFADRVAVVIGGGSGMGRAICRRLAEEGAFVHVVDLSADQAKGVAEEIVAEGGQAQPEVVDATDVAALRELYARVGDQHGRIDVLHHQVGMPGPAGIDVSEDDWARNIDVNVKSAFYATTLAFELLKRAGGKGSVTMTASTSALIGSPFSPIYSLTKGALVAYTRSLALVGAPDGVRVNIICPGPVDTPMLPQFFGRDPGANISDLMANFMTLIPMGRPARPEEIAGAVAFLASDDAGMVTGVALPVDGGQVAK